MTKEITKELKACRKAWKDNPAKLAWCCHHTILIEPLTEPAENRIAHILSAKPLNEQAIRLKNFRPVRVTLPAELDKARAEWNKASAEWAKAHAEWNKASAEWAKASAEWNKARAEWNKARAEWAKAHAEWNKASAEWNKELTALHAQDWPNNTWNGESIFI